MGVSRRAISKAIFGLAAASVIVAALAPGSAAANVSPAVGSRALAGETSSSLLAGLPAGAAVAVLKREPALPVPRGWSFPDAFSRTSGTGRMIGGALEWTDWVYDDYGATDQQASPQNSITQNADPLSPAKGSYVYPSGPADNDGADIFRAGVGVTRTSTIWRVDWNTLVDPAVPIAEWTFDMDNDSRTGASAWPANANVSSPGIERALVVSATGARLINTVTGATIATFPTTVDMSSRSFVVRIPRGVLPVSGRWRVRLAAGLADASGTGFAIPTLSGGNPASPTAPRVYNVTFRTAAQEPPHYTARSDAAVAQLAATLQNAPVLGAKGVAAAYNLLVSNFWAEADQADTLASGDVTKFSELVNWRNLEAHEVTNPPAFLRGWSDRWYVTDLKLGQGVAGGSNANPAFLGRVEPYAVYVPKDYTGRRAVALTWMLHSASVNYNQYPSINPRLITELCEDRHSICASTEGFGGDGLYVGIAEHDFWQVWRQVALSYAIARNRTVISGYSMGGLASFVLPATYPSAFSEALPLDGGFDEGCSNAPIGASQEDIAAAPDRTGNVRWVPFVISDSYTDELSPYPSEIEEARRFEAAGDRFTLYSTTTPEHVTTDAADGFSTQVATLHGTPVTKANPGTLDYTWCANTVDHTLGLGPTSVYWLSGLSQRSTVMNATSEIVATDRAIPEQNEIEQATPSAVNPPDGPPMQVLTGSWNPGATPVQRRTLQLKLTNVARLAVDTAAAKLRSGTATITTDGTTTLTLTRLVPGTIVYGPHATVRTGASKRAMLNLPAGTSTIRWARRVTHTRGRGLGHRISSGPAPH